MTATPRLRAVFAGTAAFSVPALRETARVCDLVAVVTQPARSGHRGRPAPRPVADAAIDLGVQVLEPEKIRDPAMVDQILWLEADVLVVAAYGQILPARLLDGFPLGGVNVHASLLPRWRGAAPVNAAIVNGDTHTGISIMRMEPGLDTGPVYRMESVPIDGSVTAGQLTADLAEMGAGLLGRVLEAMAEGRAPAPQPQDDTTATYAPRLTRNDGLVDWAALTADEVDRRVRGLDPWPGVTAAVAGESVRIWRGIALPGTAERLPGQWVPAPGGEPGVDVAAAGGTLYRVLECQAAGKRRMAAADFLRGRRVETVG